MKHRLVYAVLCVMAAVLVGCEWETSSDGDSWNDSYSWVDFSGTYRSSSGGAIVTGFNTTPGSDPSEISITGEILGSGSVAISLYSGLTDNKPIKTGSLVIVVGAFTLTDGGDGTLSGTAGITGTINYDTGAWSIDLLGNIVADGTLITGAYVYTSGGTAGQVDEGNTGSAIYSLTVTQTGNILVFTDSNGATYSGNIHSLNTGGGSDDGTVSGQVSASFEVTGNGSSGATVKMTGTFSAYYVAPASGQTGGQLTDRQIDGTWIERTITGDIKGVASSVTVSTPTATP